MDNSFGSLGIEALPYELHHFTTDLAFSLPFIQTKGGNRKSIHTKALAASQKILLILAFVGCSAASMVAEWV